MEELAGWDQIVQGLPAGGFKASDTPSTALDELEEEPYLNRFGEGLCHLEYTEGPLKDRHRSMGDQRWEVVKRNIHWHNNHPFLDIEESQFWQVPGGEFLRPDVLSNQRSFVLRVKDFDWESNPDRAAIVAKTTAFKLPPPHRSFGTADLHEHLERNIDSWVGRETPDGRGWAVIEMIAPFPGGNDPNPRATNDLFAKLATFWTEQFWWRKTDCFEFVRRWAAHERPKVKNESYSYTMIVHFERRDTPEAKAVNPKDEVKKILEGDFPWSRVPT